MTLIPGSLPSGPVDSAQLAVTTANNARSETRAQRAAHEEGEIIRRIINTGTPRRHGRLSVRHRGVGGLRGVTREVKTEHRRADEPVAKAPTPQLAERRIAARPGSRSRLAVMSAKTGRRDAG